MPYSIKEVTQKTGISAYTLRFYEKEGLITAVARDHNGNREYDDRHLEWLHFVLCLRSTGMPLLDIKRYLALYQAGDGTICERKAILRNHKLKIEQKMKQLYNCLELVNYKLALYDVQEQAPKTLP